MFLFYDPLYMLVMFVGLVLSGLASAWTRAAFSKWSRVPTARGLTGAEVARAILDAEGIGGVRIEPVGGFLGDHYDPRTRTLRLSPDVYAGRSVAAAGVAAHEVGHAIQHARGFAAMRLRQAMVPVANIGTNLGLWLVIIGMLIGAGGLAQVGFWLFAGFVAFTVVTLPVEIDASRRAAATLSRHHLLLPGEMAGVRRVLGAAAMTYLAAAVTAVLQLLYWAMRLGLLGGSRDD